mgnify:CR=1 FL=1
MSLWYVIVPLCVWILGQWLKVIIDVSKGQKFSLSSIWTSGGFPSTHGILTSSVLTMLALYEGMDTSLFMVAAIFSLLIRYDAMNLRYESGKHAQYINSLRSEIWYILRADDEEIDRDIMQNDLRITRLSLKERIGHTPLEVFAWIVFGIGVTVLVDYCLRSLAPLFTL